MTALTRVNSASNLSSRVVDGDTALSSFHEYNETGHCKCEHKQHKNSHNVQFAGSGEFKCSSNRRWQSSHDTREDDNRYAVADTPLTYLLTKPHEEYRTGNQGSHRGNAETPTRVYDHRQSSGLLSFKGYRNPEGLKHCKRHRTVSGISRYLPPPGLSLLSQLL